MVDSTPPGQFSVKIFEVENGHVAITLEKFPRAREKGRDFKVKAVVS